MVLVKLIIAVEDKNHQFSSDNAIKVLYNPSQITIQKTGWTSDKDGKPLSKFSPATLNVDLFFDTSIPSELPDSSPSSSDFYKESFGIKKYAYESLDVRNHVNKIFNLTNPRSELNRPPICRLIWGGRNEAVSRLEGYKGTVMFQGVLQNVTKTFTRFTAEGIPVRATLSCTFLEYEDAVQQVKKLNPIDDPIRVIKQGETLSSIAQEEYGNSALWRVIADANRLVNPRRLEVGSSLTVPPLPRQGGR
jgi:hypothetical protein